MDLMDKRWTLSNSDVSVGRQQEGSSLIIWTGIVE